MNSSKESGATILVLSAAITTKGIIDVKSAAFGPEMNLNFAPNAGMDLMAKHLF